MKAGDVVLVKARAKYWYNLSDEQLEDRRRSDAAAGHFCDSAGEPLLYSRISWQELKATTVATVVRTRGVPWYGWSRKPKGLIECFMDINGIPTKVMVVKSSIAL